MFVDFRGSSSYVSNEAPVIGQQPSRRCRCNSINRDTSPSRHLATKLMEQNTRLKNLARQMIADRGMTVAQYLVCIYKPRIICVHEVEQIFRFPNLLTLIIMPPPRGGGH